MTVISRVFKIKNKNKNKKNSKKYSVLSCIRVGFFPDTEYPVLSQYPAEPG